MKGYIEGFVYFGNWRRANKLQYRWWNAVFPQNRFHLRPSFHLARMFRTWQANWRIRRSIRSAKQETKAKSGRSNVRKITFKGNRALTRKNARAKVEGKGKERNGKRGNEMTRAHFDFLWATVVRNCGHLVFLSPCSSSFRCLCRFDILLPKRHPRPSAL